MLKSLKETADVGGTTYQVPCIQTQDWHPDLPTVFVVNGLFGYIEYYSKLLTMLDSRYNVIAVGTAGTTKPRPCTLEEDVALTKEIYRKKREEFGFTQVRGIGHSTGAYLVSELDDVSDLVLLSPVMASQHSAEGFLFSSLAEFGTATAHAVMKKLRLSKRAPLDLDAILETSAGALHALFSSPITSRKIGNDIGNFDWHTVNVPTHIIYGESDHFFTLDEESISKKFPHLKIDSVRSDSDTYACHGMPVFYPKLLYRKIRKRYAELYGESVFDEIPEKELGCQAEHPHIWRNTQIIGVSVLAALGGLAYLKHKRATRQAT